MYRKGDKRKLWPLGFLVLPKGTITKLRIEKDIKDTKQYPHNNIKASQHQETSQLGLAAYLEF